MRITNLRMEDRGRSRAVLADMTWEDCDRPARTIHYETDEPFTAYLQVRPEAFVLAALPPAMRHGEKRITVEGSLCPRLRDNLAVSMQLLHHWYTPGYVPLTLEPRDGWSPTTPPAEPRAASYLSGGVDSLATLRNNRLSFPKGHPASIRAGILVHGFDIGGTEREGPRTHIYETAYQRMSELAAVEQFDLVPIRTNIKYLDDDWTFWTRQFFGAATLSVAHLFTGWIHEVNLGSGSPVAQLTSWGSHPMLDTYYSSAGVFMRHDGVWLSRFEKLRLVSAWDLGLNHMRVCLNVKVSEGALNCGQCEKCTRTMTGLVACDALHRSAAFPVKEVTPAMIQSINIRTSGQERDWRQLFQPLSAIGRTDLVNAIQERIDDWHKWRQWTERRGFKGRLRQWDERFAGNLFTKVARRIR